MRRVTPLRINLPACKLVVHIERTIGSERARVRRVCGLCPADPHTISARFPFRLMEGEIHGPSWGIEAAMRFRAAVLNAFDRLTRSQVGQSLLGAISL